MKKSYLLISDENYAELRESKCLHTIITSFKASVYYSRISLHHFHQVMVLTELLIENKVKMNLKT